MANIRFMNLNGLKSEAFTFQQVNTEALQDYIFEHWPQEWTSGKPLAPGNIRLIFCGRELVQNTPISDYGLTGDCIVQLQINNNPQTQPKPNESCFCCVIV